MDKINRAWRAPSLRTIILLSLYACARVSAQSLPFDRPLPGQPPDQPPIDRPLPALQLEEEDVQLTVDGSWDSQLTLGFSWLFHPPLPDTGATVTENYLFPDFEPLPLFSNVIDMTISLWIYERFFLRTTLIDERLDLNSYVIGYQGAQEELVQLAQLGYGDFDISPYSYLPGRSGRFSPGLSLDLKTAVSRHELVLRLEGSTPQRVRFIGNRRVDANRIELGAYIRGRFFVLPDDDISDLRLYVEAHDGALVGDDGRFYNRVDVEQSGFLSAADGQLELYEAPAGRLLAHYSVDGLTIGHPTLGREALYAEDSNGYTDVLQPPVDFDFNTPPGSAYRVAIDGREALLLYAPGVFSPFESLNRYDVSGMQLDSSLEEDRLVELVLVSRADGSEQELPDRSLSLSPSGREIVVSNAEQSHRHHANRYPFAAGELGLPELYGRGSQRPPNYSLLDIEVRRLDAPGRLFLPADAIPGSWSVRRNGILDSTIDIDPLTGELIGIGDEASADSIEIDYRSSADQGGELVFGSGNRFFLADTLMLEVAFGARWALLTNRFSSFADEFPGSLLLSSQLVYETATVAASLSGALQLYIPDTSDHLRLLGMEERLTEISISATSLFPAPAPAASIGGQTLTDATRGMLFYRDYIGDHGQLLEYDQPNIERFPYQSDSHIGPYPASGRNDNLGEVMVLDYSLESEEWVAGLVRIADGAEVDLSGLFALSFLWRAQGSSQGTAPGATSSAADAIDIYLQIGAIGEDLDGDSILDEGESVLAPNFDFDDSRRALRLVAGPPVRAIGAPLSEDGNRNGLLDREDVSGELLYTSPELTTIHGGLPQDSWQQVHISLDADQRRRLRHSRSVRIVLLNDSLQPTDGRLLFSDIRLHGSTVVVERNSGPIAAYEQEERGDTRLSSAFPEVATRFHGGNADGQRVLRIEWPDGGSPDWELRDLVAATPTGYYRTMVIYLRLAELVTADPGAAGRAMLEIALTDRPLNENGAVGLAASIDLTDLNDHWHKLELDSSSGNLRLDGSSIGRLQRNSGGDVLLRHLTIRQRGATGGLLFLDEVHWAASQPQLDGAVAASFDWSEPAALLAHDDLVLFGNISLNQESNLRSRRFGLGAGLATSRRLYDSHTRLGFDLLGLHIDTSFDIAGDGESQPAIELGHSLIIPAATSPIMLTEHYQRSYGTTSDSFRHTSVFRIDIDHVATWRLGADATLNHGTLQQRWNARQNSRWAFPLRLDWRLNVEHRSRSYRLADNGYFNSWIESFELYSPYSQGTQAVRTVDLEPEIRLGNEDAHLRLNSTLAYRNETALNGTQRDVLDLTAALPLRFDGADGWALTPSYGRRLSLSGTAADNDDYGDDLDLYFRRIGSQDYLFASAPFVELFDRRLSDRIVDQADGLQSVNYQPRAALAFARTFGARIIDLFVPSLIELSLERNLAVAEEQRDRLTWSALLSTTALNLFGSLGAYPLVSLYATDHYISTIALAITSTRERIEWEAALSNRIGFFALDQSRLELNNRIELQQEERFQVTLKSGAELEWHSGPYRLLEVDEFELVHIETLEFALYPEANEFDSHLFTTIVGHETSLRFPSDDDFNGEVGLFARMGLGLQPIRYSGERHSLTLVGLQLGLRGRFSF